VDYGIIFQYAGYAVGTIGGIYGILKKREISRLQGRSEKARAKSYRAKAKAEEARQAEHIMGAIKNFADLFRGNKNDSTGNAEVF